MGWCSIHHPGPQSQRRWRPGPLEHRRLLLRHHSIPGLDLASEQSPADAGQCHSDNHLPVRVLQGLEISQQTLTKITWSVPANLLF